VAEDVSTIPEKEESRIQPVKDATGASTTESTPKKTSTKMTTRKTAKTAPKRVTHKEDD
jgi:hypothetical protein